MCSSDLVMARKQNMYSEFCRVEKRVMRPFTGYIRIQACVCGLANERTSSSRHHPDRPNPLGASRKGTNSSSAHGRRHPALELVDQNGLRKLSPHTDLALLVPAEPPLDVETEGAGQKGTVPHFEVGIEGKMHTVKRNIRVEKRSDSSFMSADDGLEAAPEEPVMHDHQVGTEVGRRRDGGLGRIDGGGHRVHVGRSPDLEAVQGRRVVRVIGYLKPAVQILEDRFHFHRIVNRDTGSAPGVESVEKVCTSLWVVGL